MPRKVRGFTLVELMIVLIIVAVIVTVAAPGMSILIERTKLRSYANEVVTSVYLARSEAIKRNTQMKLCSSSNGTSCNGGADWHSGWIVINPSDSQVISLQAGLSDGFLLFDPNSVGLSEVTFEPSGVSSSAAVLKLCQDSPTDGREERLITISPTGKPRVSTITEGCP